MRYCLFLLMIFFGSALNNPCSSEKNRAGPVSRFEYFQEEPFYFNKPIPSRIKILDRVDLSFFRNPLITSYRFRLEIPAGSQTTIDKKLIIWSLWTENDFADIVVPRLDAEGGYKLIIEYKTRGGSEIKKLEKAFNVYSGSSPVNPVASKSGPVPATDKTKTVPVFKKPDTKIIPPADKKVAEALPVTSKAKVIQDSKSEKSAEKTTLTSEKKPAKENEKLNPPAANKAREKLGVTEKKIIAEKDKNKESEIIKPVPLTGNITLKIDKESEIPGKNNLLDYEELLHDAIKGEDSVLLFESIQHGAGKTMKSDNGGNLFHLLDQSVASEGTILLLKKSGFSINETDDYGNTPLHYAILTGKTDYARSLINQGADLNLRNKLELAPLHLAVILDNRELVRDLIKKGADVNIKGKYGYTPLHIASELDYADITSILLKDGAEDNLKTNQKLSAKSIAKIQGNDEIEKLIKDKGSYTGDLPATIPVSNKIIWISDLTQYPEIKFDLPFDPKLAKKRQSNKVIQILSIPVFTLSSGSALYLRSEANHYYSMSKTAETEEIARTYYDKTTKLDKYAYISGSVSLVSIYSFIHSTVRKRSISGRMQKSFY